MLTICKDFLSLLQFLKSCTRLYGLCIEIAMMRSHTITDGEETFLKETRNLTPTKIIHMLLNQERKTLCFSLIASLKT